MVSCWKQISFYRHLRCSIRYSGTLQKCLFSFVILLYFVFAFGCSTVARSSNYNILKSPDAPMGVVDFFLFNDHIDSLELSLRVDSMRDQLIQ